MRETEAYKSVECGIPKERLLLKILN